MSLFVVISNPASLFPAAPEIKSMPEDAEIALAEARLAATARLRARFRMVREIATAAVLESQGRSLAGRDSRFAIGHGRAIGIYVGHVVAGLGMSELAAFSGRHRTTIAYTCARIEDRRDDAGFDELVGEIEERVRRALAASAHSSGAGA